MDRTVENLVEEWANRWPSVSGSVVIELFSNVAMQSWSGAEALIDAYMELEDKTGEGPSPKSIDKEMYMKLSQYWSDELTPEQLNKLDVFLSRVNVYD